MIILQIILLASYILLCLPPEATVSSTYDPQCALLYLPKDTVLDDYTLNRLGITYDDVKDYELLEVIEREGPFNRYSIKVETQSAIVEEFSEKKNRKCMKVALSYFLYRVSQYPIGGVAQPRDRDDDIHDLATIAKYLIGFYKSLREGFLAEDTYILFISTVSNLINNALGLQTGKKQGMLRTYVYRFDTLVDYFKEVNDSISEKKSKDTITFYYYFGKANLQLWKGSPFSSTGQNLYLAGWYFREAAKYTAGDSHRKLKEKAKSLGVV